MSKQSAGETVEKAEFERLLRIRARERARTTKAVADLEHLVRQFQADALDYLSELKATESKEK